MSNEKILIHILYNNNIYYIMENLLNYFSNKQIDSYSGSTIIKQDLSIFKKKYNLSNSTNNNYDIYIEKPYNPIQQQHMNNEIKYLGILKDTNIVPKIIYKKNNELFLTNCGEKINKNNIPDNWKEQIMNIYEILKYNNIYHNDITLDNLTILNNKIYLIDFGWANNIPSFPYFNINKKIIDNSKNMYDMFERIVNNSIELRLNNISIFVKNQHSYKSLLKD